MKKLMKIMVTATVLLCGLVITGCAAAETIKEIVDATHNQWYKYKKSDGQKIDIPILAAGEADTDNREESTVKLEDADLYFYYDTEEGLLVAVQSETKQTVEMLKGLYTQDLIIPMGATKQFTKDEFSPKKWTAFTLAVKMEKSEAPEVVSDPEKCILLNSKDNKPKIQWKKFLANYLLGKVLED